MSTEVKLVGIEHGRDVGGPVAVVTFEVAPNDDPRVVWRLPVMVQDVGDDGRNEASARMVLMMKLPQITDALRADSEETRRKLFPSQA